jgi:Icc-related predicted phosphoesterase
MKGALNMRKHVSKILATCQPQGNLEAVAALVKQAPDAGAEAVVVLGNLATSGATARMYGNIFKTLAESRLPTFYIPGPADAPIAEYLREAANIEIVYPYLHGVHATFAVAPGYVIFAGMGGTVADDPNITREEQETLRYPGWEVEYRLKFLSELKDYQKVFLFTTPPEHKGFHEPGSAALAELIKSYSPRLVLTSGKEPKREMIGVSLVVMPGSLAEGFFSVIDLHQHTVETGRIH